MDIPEHKLVDEECHPLVSLSIQSLLLVIFRFLASGVRSTVAILNSRLKTNLGDFCLAVGNLASALQLQEIYISHVHRTCNLNIRLSPSLLPLGRPDTQVKLHVATCLAMLSKEDDLPTSTLLDLRNADWLLNVQLFRNLSQKDEALHLVGSCWLNCLYFASFLCISQFPHPLPLPGYSIFFTDELSR